MPNKIDIRGAEFGRLTAVEAVARAGGKTRWRCVCQCGTEVIVTTGNLRSGNSKSCGCLNTERVAALNRTHGRSKTREYSTWQAMKSRCTNKSYTQYKDYGGRGIGVCDRWKESFENFLDDMGERPSESYSIDRINVDGDYEPGNCKWSTHDEQVNNARSNHNIAFDGRTLTASQWARRLGMKPLTILARVRKGLPVEQVLFVGRIKRRKL